MKLQIINHKNTKLFHLYYMTLLHDKFLHQEQNKQNILHQNSQTEYLLKHFYFFRFISTQFKDFASLKIQMQITFAKPFDVLNNAA